MRRSTKDSDGSVSQAFVYDTLDVRQRIEVFVGRETVRADDGVEFFLSFGEDVREV